MYTIILILVFLSGLLQPDPDSALLEQSRNQAKFYMEQINRGEQRDAYLWALSSLYKGRPEIKDYIIEHIKSNNYTTSFYAPFIENQQKPSRLFHNLVFATGSPNLFVKLLLDQSDRETRKQLKQEFERQFKLPTGNMINYAKLADHIIREDTLDSSILPDHSFHTLHFFILMDANDWKLLSEPYRENLTATVKGFSQKINVDSIKKSLSNISYFRLLYLANRYADMNQLDDTLTRDDLIPNSALKLKIFRYLDYSMYAIGYFDRALRVSREHTIPQARYLKDKQSELSALAPQAAYLMRIGKIKEAQQVNLKILNAAQQFGVNIPEASIYNNLSLTYDISGNFDKYLELQFKALEEAEEQQNYNHQLNILNNLYIHYFQNKDKKSALLYLNKSKELAEEQDNSEHLGRINIYTGILYRDFDKDYIKSEKYFEEAEQLLDKENNYKYYIELLGEQAQLYEDLKKYELSLAVQDQIINLSDSKDQIRLLQAYLSKINIYLKIDSLNIASNLLSKVQSYDLTQLPFKDIVQAKRLKAEYLTHTGESEKAYEIIKPTINQIVDWTQNSTDMQSGFWNVEAEFLDAFQLMADLLIETDRPEEAVEALDRLKTINDATLYQNPMVKSSLLNETELTQYQQLTQQLDALRKEQLLASESRQMALQSQIDRLGAQKRALDRKITSLADREPVRVNEVQSRLSGYDAVLHVTELNDRYYIATITRGSVRFKKVALDSTARNLFSNSVKALASGETNLNNLHKISDMLGIGDLPRWIENVTLIPDSYLYQLPVDILPVNDPASSYSYGGTTYFIERFKTRYLTSLNDFNNPNSRRTDYKWDFAGYGVSDFSSYTNKTLVPLPYAENEVSTIVTDLSHLSGSNKKALLNASSTKQAFKETAPNARILHLATHSEVSERDPLFSTIYMSRQDTSSDKDFPGRIFAYELFELNLANDMIMLNSCESGSGSYLQGSGIMGISRALRYAGANSVVLNLWSVNDMMASDFAIKFYQYLNDGKSKSEALRMAKLHFLKDKNANPHYWGPYMLIGDDEAIIRPHQRANVYLASSFMLLFIGLIALALVKQNLWRLV